MAINRAFKQFIKEDLSKHEQKDDKMRMSRAIVNFYKTKEIARVINLQDTQVEDATEQRWRQKVDNQIPVLVVLEQYNEKEYQRQSICKQNYMPKQLVYEQSLQECQQPHRIEDQNSDSQSQSLSDSKQHNEYPQNSDFPIREQQAFSPKISSLDVRRSQRIKNKAGQLKERQQMAVKLIKKSGKRKQKNEQIDDYYSYYSLSPTEAIKKCLFPLNQSMARRQVKDSYEYLVYYREEAINQTLWLDKADILRINTKYLFNLYKPFL